ncbi:unnamed protein product (macronuclear) [Paramecium tetraurelia]|uniref:Uncharacterized protein n=1 Tax=Paramecium tetraurelia TaxID=5888 RepID=A0CUW6_PARTE|nr:uncharacterized protein GSPATT00039039001 [Paramecium tetraurelia]CAK74583.1 unnamed protein product [Paramecium tetraurelia]|eukprot:XP_001441980.1 hypothetical protein (macronuclear) [Paramecium tetraurelia strain d4-2]
MEYEGIQTETQIFGSFHQYLPEYQMLKLILRELSNSLRSFPEDQTILSEIKIEGRRSC